MPAEDAGGRDSSGVVGGHRFASSPCEHCLVDVMPIFRHGMGRQAWILEGKCITQ